MIKIISILGLLSINLIFAQSQITNLYVSDTPPDSSKLNLRLPRFDIYIGAGIAPGGRVGFRCLFIKKFSAEIAYGYDIKNFFSLSNLQRRYSLGLNYHFKNSNTAISFLTTYIEQPNSVYEAILFSPNFGFIPLRESGINTFIRVGIYIEVIKSFPAGKWKLQSVGPNLDVGVSFNF
jgi:hypothetical protein